MEGIVFFEMCKFVITSHKDYLQFSNHFTDVLHSSHGLSNLREEEYPLYVSIDSVMSIDHTYSKKEYNKWTNIRVDMDTFLHMKYIVSYHFQARFNERFEKVSYSRFKKLMKTILKRGTWLKRKDSIQLMKYKKTSSYVLYSQFVGANKVYYLVVLTDENILTTIYEFDIKDLKFFKET